MYDSVTLSLIPQITNLNVTSICLLNLSLGENSIFSITEKII